MFTVETSGMAWGEEHRMFVCDEDNNVIVEVYGRTCEEAERRAELIADTLRDDAGEEKD